MPNTSATGGYLLPTSPAPLDDVALQDFMQDVIIGLTGLLNTLVRPSFQADPPTRPDIGVDWVGFACSEHLPEAGNAYIEINGDGLGAKIKRHETFNLRCSFYGPNCQSFAGLMRDNLEIGQNRDQLHLAGMAYVDCTEIRQFPELVNKRYYNRADVTFRMRRELGRDYAVLSFASANGTINTETRTIEWAVGPEV